MIFNEIKVIFDDVKSILSEINVNFNYLKEIKVIFDHLKSVFKE